MKFGLTDSEYSFLDQHLIQPLKARKAKIFVFGSRVHTKHHRFSDIDLLIIENEHHPIDSTFISSLLIFFEESQFPYKIDLVNNKNLAKSYRQNVEASMVEI